MKKLLILLTTLTLAWSNQELNLDLDNDGKKERIYIDCSDDKCHIIYSLSSLGKEKLLSSALEKHNSQTAFLEKTKSGFKYELNYMREGFSFQFRYEKSTHKLRLIGMEHYAFGNAGHEGRGESSINLLTEKYISQWSYADLEKDKLITPKPTIKTLKLSKVYLDDFSFMIDEYGELDEHRRIEFSVRTKPMNITVFLEKKFPNYKEHSMKKLDVGGDYIVVLESKKKGELFSELDDAYGRKAVIVKQTTEGFKVLAQNDEVVGCSTCGGSIGDPFRNITVKGNYISFEELYGACVKDFQVTTFKYNAKKKKWYLHKIGIESTYCNEELNGEPKMQTVVKTVKDFGVVEFGVFRN